MGTTYGSWIKTTGNTKVRPELTASSSTSTTSVAISASAAMNVVSGWYTEAKITGTLSATSYSSSSTTSSARRPGSGTSSSSYNNYAPTRSGSYTYARKASAYTVTISYKITIAGNAKSSTASQSFTIPALNKYTISYNGNEGEGSVTSQTKYYGSNITLASAGFSRTNYSLTGWNTAADGNGTAYDLGAIYSANANATLYAQWHLDYLKPVITGFAAERVDSSGVADDSGQYVKITFTYTGGTIDGGTSYIAPRCVVKIGSTTAYNQKLSSRSGSFSQIFGTYSENESFTITVQLYDDNDGTGTTVHSEIASAIYPIDLLGDGSAMGLMHVAVSGQVLTLPDGAHIDGGVTIAVDDSAGSGTDYDIKAALDALGWTADVTE